MVIQTHSVWLLQAIEEVEMKSKVSERIAQVDALFVTTDMFLLP